MRARSKERAQRRRPRKATASSRAPAGSEASARSWSTSRASPGRTSMVAQVSRADSWWITRTAPRTVALPMDRLAVRHVVQAVGDHGEVHRRAAAAQGGERLLQEGEAEQAGRLRIVEGRLGSRDSPEVQDRRGEIAPQVLEEGVVVLPPGGI